MARQTSSSFVTEVPLVTSSSDLAVLASRLEAGRQLYNATLSEAVKRLSLLRNSNLFTEAKSVPKSQKTARKEAFQKAKTAVRYTDFDLQAFANQTAMKSVWIKKHLDAQAIQKVATRAFKAIERMLFGNALKVRFKGKGQFASVEGKTNKQGIRWTGQGVEWLGLKLAAMITNDPVIQHGLTAKVKYVRLVRRVLNQKTYWFAQLVCEGAAYQKQQNSLGVGLVGIDLGVSTVAIVGDEETIWTPFAEELTRNQKQIRRIQRKMDRQRCAGNPDNFNPSGTAIKGKKRWNNSKRYKQTAAKKRELERKQAAHRKSSHGKLVNRTLKLGKNILAEKVSVKGWQKLFGRSIGFKAPSSFQSELKRKAENAGGSVLLFSTRKTALSQTCLCGQREKKPLSQRVHDCECLLGESSPSNTSRSTCGLRMQRDILSAYLSRYVDPSTELLSIELARDSWLGMEQSLLEGWQHGSNQSVRTEASPKSPSDGSERISNNLIGVGESEGESLDEIRTTELEPPRLQAWG